MSRKRLEPRAAIVAAVQSARNLCRARRLSDVTQMPAYKRRCRRSPPLVVARCSLSSLVRPLARPPRPLARHSTGVARIAAPLN